ncbi:hypothetical protein sscle_12g090270 [Sclerotinia sclerotiorum 1980 UF-70]|uniref:Ubiquitin-like domain-containing protein n=1 Tax=Sclerotinia sclerotiorum (strain ATCC 18683 / 1980 / Ss-1) TaxID=665079 RepID=A0A1D9QH37_SCLS1|nr:hypothetical protein sscle_12g090270 [Sclerotinia sclerotiorum 1980 UF-70]
MASSRPIETKIKAEIAGYDLRTSDGAANAVYVSFGRTVRVPDNGIEYPQLPDLGKIPLYSIRKYASKLSSDIVVKGGAFIPIRRSEAFWLNFHSHSEHPFAIKIYVDGINIISGETKSATQQNYKVNNCKQDYIVVPGQHWFDGIPNADGKVTQFPTAPVYSVIPPRNNSGSNVAQISCSDSSAGIQFEIIPTFLGTANKPERIFQIFLKFKKSHTLQVNSSMTLWDIKNRIHDLEGIPPYLQILIHAGRTLRPNHLTLSQFNIQKVESKLYLVPYMYQERLTEEKTILPEGLLHQPIHKDILAPQRYDRGNQGIVNVQLFDPKTFSKITEEEEPSNPPIADIYALKSPFSQFYGEQGGIWERIFDSIVAKGYDGLNEFQLVKTIENRSEAKIEHGAVELNEVDRQSKFVARVYLEAL